MLNIAHRGASAQVHENTLAAFRKALALGAHGVELDVQRCKGGEIVVMHDDTVDRTTNGTGKVAELAFADLRKFATKNGEHVPTLEEALIAVGTEKHCFIEIKHEDAALPAARIVADYAAKGFSPERLWLISFNLKALVLVRKEFPALAIGASFERLPAGVIERIPALGARAIFPQYTNLTQAQVQQAQALGLQVIPWTVNEPGDIDRVRQMGVDGIISDWPDRLAT